MNGKADRVWNDLFLESMNPAVKLVGCDRASSFWRKNTPKNEWKREYYDVWYTVTGRGRVKINERWIDYAPGQLFLIRPGENYQGFETVDPEGHWIYFMHFSLFPGDSEKTQTLARNWPRRVDFRHHSEVKDLFVQLFDAYTTKPIGHMLQLKVLTITLIEKVLCMQRLRRNAVIKPFLYGKISAAREFIINHAEKDITLEDIAAHIHLSPSYFSISFTKYFGCPPISFHIDCRIQNAKLLLSKGFNVTETADKVGFHSIHQFSKTFKNKTGVCPSEYATDRPAL